MNTDVATNPAIAITMKAIWAAKFRSVVVLVVGLSISLGMKMKIMISRIGMITPTKLYISGRLELRHMRHHKIENNITAMMMIVPAPTVEAVFVWAEAKANNVLNQMNAFISI